jgi:hypothetical protein
MRKTAEAVEAVERCIHPSMNRGVNGNRTWIRRFNPEQRLGNIRVMCFRGQLPGNHFDGFMTAGKAHQ